VRHARYFRLQLAGRDLTQRLFGKILRRIERLVWHPTRYGGPYRDRGNGHGRGDVTRKRRSHKPQGLREAPPSTCWGSVNELTDWAVRSVDAAMKAEWLHIGNPGSGGPVNEARDDSEA
jgi:hypothetical protein